jgi:parvulin-like peptidyl-prolyl isomerase
MIGKQRSPGRGASAASAIRQLISPIAPIFLLCALGLDACSLNSLHLPWMPAAKSTSAVTRPSPYAPVAIGPPAPQPQLDAHQYGDLVDQVIASVDGSPITDLDVQNANSAGTNSPSGTNIGTGGLDRDAALKQLIEQQLLDQEAQKYSGRVDESDVDRFIQQLEERNHVTDAQLREQLQQHGTSYDAFRKNAFKQVAAITMVDHEVRQKIHIPDSEVQAYYKNHPEEFTVSEEKYRLAQILIAVPSNASPDKVAAAKKKADEVHAQVVKGKDFGTLAKEYSDDDSKTKGGELGEFNPGDLNDEIEAAIKPLKAGAITPPVHTRFGFHIVKVEEHQQPGEPPFAAVKDQIREKLVTEQAKDRFGQWVEQDLIKQHDVETLN